MIENVLAKASSAYLDLGNILNCLGKIEYSDLLDYIRTQFNQPLSQTLEILKLCEGNTTIWALKSEYTHCSSLLIPIMQNDWIRLRLSYSNVNIDFELPTNISANELSRRVRLLVSRGDRRLFTFLVKMGEIEDLTPALGMISQNLSAIAAQFIQTNADLPAFKNTCTAIVDSLAQSDMFLEDEKASLNKLHDELQNAIDGYDQIACSFMVNSYSAYKAQLTGAIKQWLVLTKLKETFKLPCATVAASLLFNLDYATCTFQPALELKIPIDKILPKIIEAAELPLGKENIALLSKTLAGLKDYSPPSISLELSLDQSLKVLYKIKPELKPRYFDVRITNGPLFVDGIRVAFDDQCRLSVTVSGGLSISGLQLTFIDFGLSANIDDIIHKNVLPHLSGLGVEYGVPPLSLGGSIQVTKKFFSGGIKFALKPFGVSASCTFDPENNRFTVMSWFPYAIGGTPLFFIDSFGVGIGINSHFLPPTSPEDVPRHALFKSPVGGPQYDEFVKGEYWLALGITFTSLKVIDGKAVAILSLGATSSIDVIGQANTAPSLSKIISAQLSFLASIDPTEARILGQLTGAKLLDMDLTGGFGFYLRLQKPNAGDFILCIGGFHPSHPEPRLPSIPRVGISTSEVGITFRGEGYQVLSSHYIAAGIALAARRDIGPFWAYLRIAADFYVQFSPFKFGLSVLVQIGAGFTYTLKLCFIKVHVSISINLSIGLQIEGPPLYGRATIDLDFCRITFGFGHSPGSSGASWSLDKELENAITFSVGAGRVDGNENAPLGSDFVISVHTALPALTVNKKENTKTIKIVPINAVLAKSNLQICVLVHEKEVDGYDKLISVNEDCYPRVLWEEKDPEHQTFYSGGDIRNAIDLSPAAGHDQSNTVDKIGPIKIPTLTNRIARRRRFATRKERAHEAL